MTKERDLTTNPIEPKRREVKLGTDVRSVPTVDKQTILDLQSRDSTTRAKALLTVAEKVVPAIPKDVGLPKRDATFVREAVYKAFDDSGGHTAFADWAILNPDKFYPLLVQMGKLQDNKPTQATQIIVQSNIPSNPLDANTSQSVTVVGNGNFTIHNELDGEDEDDGDED